MKAADLRPQPASGGSAPQSDTRSPRPQRQQEKDGERQPPQRDREQQADKPADREHQCRDIGDPKPQLRGVLGNQALPDCPLFRRGHHVLLGGGELTASGDATVGVKGRSVEFQPER